MIYAVQNDLNKGLKFYMEAGKVEQKVLTSTVIPAVSHDMQNSSPFGGECDTFPAESWQADMKLIFVQGCLHLNPAVWRWRCVTKKRKVWSLKPREGLSHVISGFGW